MIGIAQDRINVVAESAKGRTGRLMERTEPEGRGAVSSQYLREMLRWSAGRPYGFPAQAGFRTVRTSACVGRVFFSITHVAAFKGSLQVTITPDPATAVGAGDIRLLYATFSAGPSNFQATSALSLPDGSIQLTFRGVGPYAGCLTGIRAAAGALLVEGRPNAAVTVIPCKGF
ncbi:hypothetical protein [Chlorobium sp. N1]|uniref:hypothetical protein n=1 Tax=Chlorobium sp. N1 TaxID=2491138 RepID=UPI00103B7E31|nr:hypothetical protein [Chlorobium sp. N1]TCD48601.1 hypothetical protein E0L29_01610 [Chlorobium sp. N1]